MDVNKEHILEMAVIVTDGDLTILAEGPDLVIHQEDSILNGMDEWNTKHHGEVSGGLGLSFLLQMDD